MKPPTSIQTNTGIQWLNLCAYANLIIAVAIAVYFFLSPVAITCRDLTDPGVRSGGMPRSAWSLHRHLSPRFEDWAQKRMNSTRAVELTTQNISGTEWPLFGTVFYLWATESLQDEWERNHSPGRVAPKVYAAGAIDAAARLIIDPKQAHWVKLH